MLLGRAACSLSADRVQVPTAHTSYSLEALVYYNTEDARCTVCGSLMRQEIIEHETHTAIRLHCVKRHAHGDICCIPRQWRGPFAVEYMRVLNASGKGVWSHSLNKAVPWPVEAV